METLTITDRFWAKVNKTETCWLWTAAHTPNGYGQFGGPTGLVLAHRYAYELLVGEIPDGLQLDHLCRVRNCVNPAHLEPVTQQENIRRGVEARTTCRNGHPRTPQTLYVHPNDPMAAECRVCIKIRDDRRNKARSEARRLARDESVSAEPGGA